MASSALLVIASPFSYFRSYHPGCTYFIKGSSGPTRILTERKATKRAMKKRRLGIASEIDKLILYIIQKNKRSCDPENH